MKRIHSLVVATVLGLVCFHASAQKVRPQAQGLCASNEEPVFSCKLQGNSPKTVSLCASPISSQGERSFRYRYGRPSKIELEYPAAGNGGDAFSRTLLHFAGSTGGYAFSFSNEGYKYILYRIAGTGFERSGLLVQRDGQIRADRDMHCKPSASMATKNHHLWESTSKWKVDADLDAHNLPSTN
jgi:hypothetical protein